MTTRYPTGKDKPSSLLLLPAMIMLVLAAACGASNSQPTPTPTSTPQHSLILGLTDGATVADLIRVLPDDARACIRSALGEGAARRFEDVLLFGGNGRFLPQELPLKCLKNDVLADVVLAGLSSQTGGLTDETVTCIRGTFQTLNIASFISATGGEFDATEASDVIGPALTLLLCLTDEEAGSIDLGSLGGNSSALTLADLRCVTQHVDINELLEMFEAIEAGGTPDLRTGFVVAAAFEECGADLLSASSVEGES